MFNKCFILMPDGVNLCGISVKSICICKIQHSLANYKQLDFILCLFAEFGSNWDCIKENLPASCLTAYNTRNGVCR